LCINLYQIGYELMRILVDSREQRPYTFGRFNATTEIAVLPVGDYSLPGFENRIAVERKSLEDLIGCLKGDNRARFERELSKGAVLEIFTVVVECPLTDVFQGRYRSEMRAHAALQSLFSFQVRYRISFIWAGNREGAEYVTYSLLQKYLREIGERYKLAIRALGA
jgi:DNA excision repair protein ERCC-4